MRGPGAELMGADRTVDGRRIWRLERRRIPFLALIEVPEPRNVHGHTSKVARFAGWIGSSVEGPYTARARLGDGSVHECAAEEPRPDAVKRFPRRGMDHAYGFSLFVDLPHIDRPLPVRLELTDGRYMAHTTDYRIMPEAHLLALETYIGDPPALRELAARHLRGRGLEFGALHAPVEVDPSCEMHYADKRTRSESLALFYDVREWFDERMVEVDHVMDLDLDDLASLEPYGYDFFVAAGVIEHLVNPLRFLANLHRIMRPGSLFLLGAPDRAFTWDCDRELTTNQHLLGEYERREHTLSEEHLEEYIRAASPIPLPNEEPHRTNLLRFHRERSIHVHVWDEASFDGFLRFANERLGLTFELVEHVGPRQAAGNSLYVLRKPG